MGSCKEYRLVCRRSYFLDALITWNLGQTLVYTSFTLPGRGLRYTGVYERYSEAFGPRNDQRGYSLPARRQAFDAVVKPFFLFLAILAGREIFRYTGVYERYSEITSALRRSGPAWSFFGCFGLSSDAFFCPTGRAVFWPAPDELRP